MLADDGAIAVVLQLEDPSSAIDRCLADARRHDVARVHMADDLKQTGRQEASYGTAVFPIAPSSRNKSFGAQGFVR